MKTVQNINSFVAGELSPRFAGRSDIKWYHNGCKILKNMNVFVQGGATKRPGTYYISTAAVSNNYVRLIPFEYSTTQAYVLEFGDYYMRVYKDGGIVLDGASPYVLTTPFAAEDVFDLKFAQTADTLYLVHPDYSPQVLTRQDHNAWTIADVDFYGGPFLEENETATTLTPSATTGSITLTASTSTFNADHVGAFFKFVGPYKKEATITAEDTFTDSIEVEAGQVVVVSLSNTWEGTMTLQRSTDVGSTWVDHYAWSSNTSYQVTEYEDDILYKLGCKTGNLVSGTCDASLTITNQWGYAEVTGYTSDTVVSATVIKELPNTSATTKWSEGAWSDYQGYPSAISFFNQRLILAGTVKRPQTWWGSQLSDYTNFDTGTGLDDEAFGFTIESSNVNTIQWLSGSRTLMAGTASAEWQLSSVNEALTPTTPLVSQQTSHGSANLRAINVGYSTLYIQDNPSKLQSMHYDYRIDGWQSEEISLRAENLLREGAILDWAYAEKPDNTIYMVLDTGDIITCTYNTIQEITAFAQLTTTEGSFESVAVIPGTDRDEVWVVVNRNGTRMIEQFTSPYWTQQTEYIYMDSALTYNGSATTTITGLSHLEGKEVAVLTDGSVHPNRTVTGGSITLQITASVVHVGLPYNAVLQTMRLVPPSEFGLIYGKSQCIYDVQILLDNTIGGKIGIDTDNLYTMPRFVYPVMNEAPTPYTGIVTKNFNKGFEEEMYITLVNDQPLPFTVLGISYTIAANVRR